MNSKILAAFVAMALSGCNTFATPEPEALDGPDSGGEVDAGDENNDSPGLLEYELVSFWQTDFPVSGVEQIEVVGAPSGDDEPGYVVVGARQQFGVELHISAPVEEAGELRFESTTDLGLRADSGIDVVPDFDMTRSTFAPAVVMISGIGSQDDCDDLSPSEAIWSWHTEFELGRGGRAIRTTTGACVASGNPGGTILPGIAIMEDHFGTHRVLYRERADQSSNLLSIERDSLLADSVISTGPTRNSRLGAGRGGVFYSSGSGRFTYWSGTTAIGDSDSVPSLADADATIELELGADDSAFAAAALTGAGVAEPAFVGVDRATGELLGVRTGCSFEPVFDMMVIESVECPLLEAETFPNVDSVGDVRLRGTTNEYLGAVWRTSTQSIDALMFDSITMAVDLDSGLQLGDRQLVSFDFDAYSLRSTGQVAVIAALSHPIGSPADLRIDVWMARYEFPTD